ncbi:MAG: galactokinase [Lachnospiraceae bacterium]|nr:galactokinase [Lachnospiraceae bacterium]
MFTEEIRQKLKDGFFYDRIANIYGSESLVPYQRERYLRLLSVFEETYGKRDVYVFSAPGRTEIGGNHTDHQHGKVLAASVHLDTVAVTAKTDDGMIRVLSEGYPEIVFALNDLTLKPEEKETTVALIKGILRGFTDNNYEIGGFSACISSDVLIGAGLSSSAAFETLIGTILSALFNENRVSPIQIAQIGQYAENVYFGKPCGLMDQMASSVGGMVYIDFADPKEPFVESIKFDLKSEGYRLCITDTKGSHADLTEDYAAVPAEMKAVAAYFGKEVLLGITEEDIIQNWNALREKAGDRAVLRAMHFIQENERVERLRKALLSQDMDVFLETIQASGKSSFCYLQNVYSNHDVKNQSVSLALMMSEQFQNGEGACRVHGGGFAGTIQAFVKSEQVDAYKENMEKLFGEDSCHIMYIRKYGGICVIE